MSVIAGASYAALATREKLRGGIGKAKVRRYWPGKAPAWAEEAEEDKIDVLDRAFPKHDDDLGVVRKDDPRLRRLARTESCEQVKADHRRVRQAAEVISTEEEEELRNQESRDEEEDEDVVAERRRRIREKNLKRAREEEADLLPLEEEVQDEEEEEDESEYETDDDSDTPGRTMFKPVFVPKAERDTVAEREKLEAEEKALEESAKRKLEMRKIETKQIVVEEVRKDEEIMKNKILQEADIGDVDTDDEVNEAEEYEAWRTRETARIKRERDEKEAMLRESDEADKLRKMTEKERRVWEKENPETSSRPAKKKKTKFTFMQRYYHKGAFYQEDSILQRDFSAPTLEDKFDKSKLRGVMQVKKFGRSGRTKWTHLLKEDTTKCGGDPWSSSDPRRDEYIKNMSCST